MYAHGLVLMLFLSAPVALGESYLENVLTQESCQLASNDTLRQMFQRAVRMEYPNATTTLTDSKLW